MAYTSNRTAFFQVKNGCHSDAPAPRFFLLCDVILTPGYVLAPGYVIAW